MSTPEVKNYKDFQNSLQPITMGMDADDVLLLLKNNITTLNHLIGLYFTLDKNLPMFKSRLQKMGISRDKAVIIAHRIDHIV